MVAGVLLLVIATLSCAQSPSTWCNAPRCASLEILAEFTKLTFDWTGSGFSSEADAIAHGVFIPESNLITGINFYEDTVFLTVPRWRSGVPSTLNTLAFNASTGLPLLRPYPNWEWQRKYLHYVQAVFVDRVNGEMWIIDTGRENFYNNDSSTIINRAASLIVISIVNTTVLYNITFPNEIFPFNSSFLNDIRVDVKQKRAYMTDTNLAGLGAIVAVDVVSGLMRRISGPPELVESGFVVEVGGKMFPEVQAPADGIALSPDNQFLYFSVITGSKIFRVPTSMLLDMSLSEDTINQATTVLFDKGTCSDGMEVIQLSSPGSSENVLLALYGGMSDDSLQTYMFDSTASISTADHNRSLMLTQNQQQMEWVDTIIGDDNPGSPDTDAVVYFTSNRLPQYVFWTMDFEGGRGANMRVFKMIVKKLPQESNGSGNNDVSGAPAWAIGVMAALAATLGGVLSLYWVIRAKAPVNSTLDKLESAPLASSDRMN